MTLAALVVGTWQFISGKTIEAANWVMAAGGLGLIVFSAVQLHREARRDADRLAAARAKLKPAAWLARRMCEQAVIESAGKSMQQWLVRWYTPVRMRLIAAGGPPDPLDVLEERMRETVSLAAEASEGDVRAADTAFNAFIVAANILNHLNATVGGAVELSVYLPTVPRGRQAANHLAAAARALEALAPRGAEEPSVPVDPRFTDER